MDDLEPLISIVRILSRNEGIFVHGRRVARLSCDIAGAMKYCDKGVRLIRIAAVTHDIGKIQLPEEIINKPAALDKGERELIRKHPELGYQLLQVLKAESIVAEVALQHHERLDGSGYPFGLQAKDINPVARIIAVADVIDTMISPQTYRPALTAEEALREIKQNSGLLYDPEVVAVSLAFIEKGWFRV
ncbi:MAG: HD domain-containing phosphohydrolase [Candidatus Omnitrophota bacterium]